MDSSLRILPALALLLALGAPRLAHAQGTCNVQVARISAISNPVVVEGNSGTTTVTFDVHCDPCGPVFAKTFWRINDGTATTADNDYVDTSGVFDAIGTGNAPEVWQATVTINGDTNFEGDETFQFEIIQGLVGEEASPSVGPPCFFVDVATGTATILNDDAANQPPTADAGPNQTAECAGPGGTAVALDGSGSSDPDGDALTYTWTGPFPEGGGSVTGVSPAVTLPLGMSTVTLTVDDGNGETDSDDVTITVQDTQAPVVALNGPAAPTLECGIDSYVELGASATDVCAGPLPAPVPAGAVDDGTPGVYVVSYTADDGNGNAATAERTVTVADTTPPAITLVGADPLVLQCAVDAYAEPGATVSDACDESPTLVIDDSAVDVSTPGSYPVTYTATDASGNTSTATRTVEVVDTIAPTITTAAGPAVLWPPNHKYHAFLLGDLVSEASDLCDLTVDASDAVLAGVTSDEPEDAGGGGDGNTADDIVIAADCRSVDLRAERQGGSNGRVYALGLAVADASGNVGVASFQVHVPHSKNSGALDDGPAYAEAGCVAARLADAAPLDASGALLAAGTPAEASLSPSEIPTDYVLEGNYPNPFNPQTTIRFGLPERAAVTLVVYDVMGRAVERLVHGVRAAGVHTVTFEARGLPSGLYVYRLETPAGVLKRTMLLLK